MREQLKLFVPKVVAWEFAVVAAFMTLVFWRNDMLAITESTCLGISAFTIYWVHRHDKSSPTADLYLNLFGVGGIVLVAAAIFVPLIDYLS